MNHYIIQYRDSSLKFEQFSHIIVYFEHLEPIFDLPNMDDDTPNPLLENDLEIEPLSPSDLLSPVSPTAITFLLDPQTH